MSVTGASVLDTVLVNALKTSEGMEAVEGEVGARVHAPVTVGVGAVLALVAVAAVTAPAQDPAHPSADAHPALSPETTLAPSLAPPARTGQTAQSPATSLPRGTAPRAEIRASAETDPGLVPEVKQQRENHAPGADPSLKAGLADPGARAPLKADRAVGGHLTAGLVVVELTRTAG